MTTIGTSIGAIAGIIGILIFVNVYAALNMTLVPASVVTLLNLVSLLLAAGLIIGILVSAFRG